MMNRSLPSPRFLSRSLLSAALLAAGLCAMQPASANGNIEPFTDILTEPNSAGLGVVMGTEVSPYRGEGSRFDMLPLYLFEGERLYLHSNRVGLKLFNGSEQRLDLLVERRLEGFPATNKPASLEEIGRAFV